MFPNLQSTKKQRLAPIQQIPSKIALEVLQYLDIDSLLTISKSLLHWNLAVEQEISQFLKETQVSLIPKEHQACSEQYWPKLHFTTFDVRSGEVVFDVVESGPVKYNLKNPRNLSVDQIIFEQASPRDPKGGSLPVTRKHTRRAPFAEYLLKKSVTIPLRPQGNLQFTEQKHHWDFFYHVLSVSPASSEVHFTPLTFQCNISFLFPSKNLTNPKFLTPKKLMTLWRKMTSTQHQPFSSNHVPTLPDPKKHSTVRSALGTKLFIRTKSRARFIEIE
ncbi:hypothetical protein K7432_004910 [Basidiobolus ranarum]|uniref:F-box domain-containing protein n=1 Tax=Basidiobolus ranarum TaxID=34480 RepID=A0ABR2W4F0_9FUNG